MSERAIRTTRVEVIVPKDDRDAWLELSINAQRLLNTCWQEWLSWHVVNDSAAIIERYISTLREWHAADKKTRGAKPKLDLKSIDNELSKRIYASVRRRLPTLNTRAVVLAIQKWRQTLTTRKAANGSLPGWMSILIARESIPSFCNPQPINFDKQNATLGVEDIVVRLQRDTTSEKARNPSRRVCCRMVIWKRKAASVRAIIRRIVDGEYEFRGSALQWTKGKWFALISYRMPKTTPVGLDPNKVVHVIPGKRRPWVLKIGDRRTYFGGTGSNIDFARRMILQERRERREHYRWSRSNARHGRKRAMSIWTKLSSKWLDFTKRYNHQCSRTIIDICKREGAGKVIYHQPTSDVKTFLAEAGNDVRSAMSWEWFQVGSMLAYKCDGEGIEYEQVKWTRKIAADRLPDVRKNNQSDNAQRLKGRAAAVR
tara:strand:- start:3206 stop:4489 length:1284 start_codon:yes stop_codon:yes gene_type:complete